MSLLFLAPAPPLPAAGGGALRMYQMIRFLGDRYDVDLLGPAIDGAETAERLLRSSCRDVVFVPPVCGLRQRLRLGPYDVDPALAGAVRHRISGHRYAAVHVEKPAMLPYLPRRTPVPVVLDTFAFGLVGAWRALQQERGPLTRARNALRLLRFAAFDAFCWPATRHILVVSEIDKGRCQRARPGSSVVVVPNGVDCDAVRPGPLTDGSPPVIVFTGDMSFQPNVDAAMVLATRILPAVHRARPDAVLHIVGRNPHARVRALEGRAIRVVGGVPDMLPYLHAASIYVAPHCSGAGTRTKLLEAMAAGLPIVTTSVGIEGIEAVNDREVLIADDHGGQAAAILRLLADREERRRLGTAARRLAEEKYDWQRCLAPLAGVYGPLLASRASR